MTHPEISLAMIVRNGGKTFRECLKSVAPHVDEIIIALDTRTTDNSAKIAKKFGAKVYPYKWERQDFSAARNFSFTKVTKPWVFWCDADDIIEGAERLHELAASAPPEVGGFWLPYLYAFDDAGNCTTLLDRERLLRMNAGWEWQGWLHEVLVPALPVLWGKDDETLIIHKARGDTRTSRNLPILFEWLKHEPDNIRIKMFVGNQYFAERDFRKAVKWYTEFWTDPRTNPYDRYASASYAARSLRELNNLPEANRADIAAATTFPEWADAWIGLAENAILVRKWQVALTYAEIAAGREPAHRAVMVNPLDYSVRLENIFTKALGELGRYEEALEHCEKALMVRPHDKENVENRENLQRLMRRQASVKAFVTLASEAPQESVLRLANGLHDGLLEEKAARDVFMPVFLRASRRGTQPTVAIVCGQSVEEWADPTPETRGIGGSETAVVEMSRRMAADGWNVEVYNSCGRLEGPYGNVVYVDWQRLNLLEPCDLFISWRKPSIGPIGRRAKERWLWMHDLNYGDQRIEVDEFDKILGVSSWHADYLKMVYPGMAEKVGYLPNGINLDRFQVEKPPERHAFRCVYSSSPDRGLETLLRVWPRIKSEEPDAELHIFYGWESLLATVQVTGATYLLELKAMLERLMKHTSGVHWRGRISQGELALEFLAADIWPYPTDFVEVFCITALEALAAGLIPVTSQTGALSTVIGDAGLSVPGNARSTAFIEEYQGKLLLAMRDVALRQKLKANAAKQIELFTWDRVYQDHWKPKLLEVVGAHSH